MDLFSSDQKRSRSHSEASAAASPPLENVDDVSAIRDASASPSFTNGLEEIDVTSPEVKNDQVTSLSDDQVEDAHGTTLAHRPEVDVESEGGAGDVRTSFDRGKSSAAKGVGFFIGDPSDDSSVR